MFHEVNEDTPFLPPYSVHRFALWSFLLGSGTHWGQRRWSSASGAQHPACGSVVTDICFQARVPSRGPPSCQLLPQQPGRAQDIDDSEGCLKLYRAKEALHLGRPQKRLPCAGGPCPSPSPCLQEPISGPLRALRVEMQASAGQSSAPSEVRCDGAPATFAQPLACLRYVPCGGTPGRLCPAEGTWRPLAQSRSLTGKQSLGIPVFFRDV